MTIFDKTAALAATHIAQDALRIEAEAVLALVARIDPAIDDSMARATALVLQCTGRVVVSGMGKSGHIARKIAATLASTGTPAFFVHPAEAAHGDLGMITSADVLIALSNSGTTEELMTIVPLIAREGAKIIAITGRLGSSLAILADVHLDASVAREACPLDLAPTASTTAALAMGDALAMAVLSARGFGKDDFARSHPGGALGRKLLTHVYDVMRTGEQLPTVRDTDTVTQALMEISRKGMGMTAVLDDAGALLGIFTDGDLRRAIERVGDIRSLPVGEVMTRNPLSISPDVLAVQAAKLMDEMQRNQLLVVKKSDAGAAQLVGALHMHDLMRAKVI